MSSIDHVFLDWLSAKHKLPSIMLTLSRKAVMVSKAQIGTFAPNKVEPIHRWYSYLEGYSAAFIQHELSQLSGDIKSVYDPFAGSGTTIVAAQCLAINGFYSETNPFMQKVIAAKTKCVRNLKSMGNPALLLEGELGRISSEFEDSSLPVDLDWGGFGRFFRPEVLMDLQRIDEAIDHTENEDLRTILAVLLCSEVVRCSEMIRRGDLRSAKPGEKKSVDYDIFSNFATKVREAIMDLELTRNQDGVDFTFLAPDARDITGDSLVDCVVTSPPYLNGTNYIRNTKLELKLSGCISQEKELARLHSIGIIAGINNVSKRNPIKEVLPSVAPMLEELDLVSYDNRIQKMIAGYFVDMRDVLIKLSQVLRSGGHFIMDIGDSQFAGVHIPTHDVLDGICAELGFQKYDEDVLRKRRSKNGMVLSQRVMKYRLEK